MQSIKIAKPKMIPEGFGCSEPGCREAPKYRIVVGGEIVFYCSKHVCEVMSEICKVVGGKAKGGEYFDE